MNRVAAYLLRCLVILIGYAAASLAASAFIHVMFLGSAGFAATDAPKLAPASFIFSIPFVALFVAYFGFVPSAVVILISEILGRRDWLFYTLAGGLVAAAFLGFVHQAGNSDFDAFKSGGALAVIGSGMIGGIFYWLTAGRWAGSWRTVRTPYPAISPGPSES